MIDRILARPIVRQCQLLALARSTASDQTTPVSPDELALRRRIDERHLEHPFGGARMLSKMLKREGHPVGRRRVPTLMKRMGLHALYRQPHTSKRHPAHPVYPYQLRDLTITRSKHVWAAASPISRCNKASSMCSPRETGRAAGCWRGVCPIP